MNFANLKPEKCILTFGYGNRRNYEIFAQFLEKYNVKYVIDVRKNPRAWSRRWYGDKIEEFCLSLNIKYLSQTSLGNTSGNEKWIPPDREEAEESLQKIAQIACNHTVLLLCAEMDYHRCHRVAVANRLSELVETEVINL
ncbi:MAG: DUF488 domain-containing protein [Oscillatoria sp. PMC 1051.18]|nr:DUF488 domain-containing protein [Oscillatoria sp. PMC 1050.18]MEC5032656.1 DUF488 domain-containing protein [Oscillatoria sp. PMC 1051.18]